MKRNTYRTALLISASAALTVLASSPSMRTATRAAANPSKPSNSAQRPNQAGQQRLAENYGKVPLSFEANQGQTDPRVKFISRGNGYTLFLTSDEAVLALRSRQSSVVSSQLQKTPGHGLRTTDTLRMKLVGANEAAKVTALDELPGKSNYFIGNDPKQWRKDVPTYGRVKYEGVYPGVDLVYYGNQRQLEYDFVVAPGADPKAITLAVASGLSPARAAPSLRSGQALKGGATAGAPTKARQVLPLRIDASGDLVVQAEGGEIRFHKPVVYQPTGDAANPKSKIQNRKLLDGHYVLTADNRIGFEVPGYDKSKPLV